MNNLITKEFTSNVQLSKASIKEAYNSAIKAIDNGLIDEVELQVFAKYFTEIGKALSSKDLKDKAFDSLGGTKDYTYKGVKVEPIQTSVKYDFTNSDAFNKITEKIEINSFLLKEQLDEVKKIAKTIRKPNTYNFIEPETGEITELEILPAIKTSTDSVKVTFPKD